MHQPLLRVSRPVAACARCRAAKIKCDGKLPACTSCIRSNRAFECSNSNDHFARGKERSYVASLESKIEKLERQVAETRRNQNSYGLAAVHAAAVAEARLSDCPDAVPATFPDKFDISHFLAKSDTVTKEATQIDDLISGFGFLAVNATTRDFDGVSNSLTYAKIIFAACMRDNVCDLPPTPLPPHHTTLGRAQFYLNTVFILLPFLDESAIYACIDNVYKENATPSPFDLFTLRLILAVTSASMSERRGDAHYIEGLGHVLDALPLSEALIHPGNVECIQALLLLAEYASFEPTFFDNWMLIGAAARVMVDMGLHQDPARTARLTISRDQLELRRRIFYSVYCLDRSISALVGRSLSFSDDACNVALPLSAEAANKPNTTEATPGDASPGDGSPLPTKTYDTARDFFRFRQIQSRFYTDLHQTSRTPMEYPYRYIWRIYHELSAWYGSIAPNPNQKATGYFSTELLFGYISLLAPSPRCPTPSPYSNRLMFEHILALIDLMEDLHQFESPDPHGYRTPVICQFLFRVNTASRLLLDLLIGNGPELFEDQIMPPPCQPAPVGKKKKPPVPLGSTEIDPTPFLTDVPAPEIPAPSEMAAMLHLDSPTSSHSPPGPGASPVTPTGMRTLLPHSQSRLPPGQSSPKVDISGHYSTRSLVAIRKATQMLRTYGEKFDMIVFHDAFKSKADPLLDTLREAQNDARASALRERTVSTVSSSMDSSLSPHDRNSHSHTSSVSPPTSISVPHSRPVSKTVPPVLESLLPPEPPSGGSVTFTLAPSDHQHGQPFLTAMDPHMCGFRHIPINEDQFQPSKNVDFDMTGRIGSRPEYISPISQGLLASSGAAVPREPMAQPPAFSRHPRSSRPIPSSIQALLPGVAAPHHLPPQMFPPQPLPPTTFSMPQNGLFHQPVEQAWHGRHEPPPLLNMQAPGYHPPPPQHQQQQYQPVSSHPQSAPSVDMSHLPPPPSHPNGMPVSGGDWKPWTAPQHGPEARYQFNGPLQSNSGSSQQIRSHPDLLVQQMAPPGITVPLPNGIIHGHPANVGAHLLHGAPMPWEAIPSEMEGGNDDMDTYDFLEFDG